MIDVRRSSVPEPHPFRVLLVGTGNLARSAAAQRLLQAHLAADGVDERFVVSSAGTFADVGRPVHPETGRALADLGVAPDDHVAHQLTERRVAQAGLILTMARLHRDEIVDLIPSARTRAFTLTEMVRLVSAMTDEPGTPQALVASMAVARSQWPPANPVDDDVDDLQDAGPDAHRRVTLQLAELTRFVARALTASLVPVLSTARL